MTAEEWVEQQLAQAPSLSEATARRVSAVLFPVESGSAAA
jgi:hypothetical protein